MSEESLRSGTTWFTEITRHLESIEIGIVCLTPENLDARWIHFEAGALANKVSANKRVIPYLIGLEPGEVTAPLSFFQHRRALEGPTFELVKDINEATGSTVGASILKKKFEAFWGELHEAIEGAGTKEFAAKAKVRPTDDMVREILEIARGLRTAVAPNADRPWEAVMARMQTERMVDYANLGRRIQIDPRPRAITLADFNEKGPYNVEGVLEGAAALGVFGRDDNEPKKP
jgi:hypothetical protein